MGNKGKFVLIEGGDGVGKTTVSKLLAPMMGHQWVRFPGETKAGARIRELFINETNLHPVTQMNLMLADQAQTVKEVILPARFSNRNLIADRFFLSSFFYQCSGGILPGVMLRGLKSSLRQFLKLEAVPPSFILPDVTVVLTASAETLAERRKVRQAATGTTADRFEDAELAERIAALYGPLLQHTLETAAASSDFVERQYLRPSFKPGEKGYERIAGGGHNIPNYLPLYVISGAGHNEVNGTGYLGKLSEKLLNDSASPSEALIHFLCFALEKGERHHLMFYDTTNVEPDRVATNVSLAIGSLNL